MQMEMQARLSVLLTTMVVIVGIMQGHNVIASTTNTCEQRKPLPGSEGKVFVTTRMCLLNGCFGCFSTHVSSELDKVCKSDNADHPNWESYKCCAYNRKTCPSSE